MCDFLQIETLYSVEIRDSRNSRKMYDLNKLHLSVGSHTGADIFCPGLCLDHAELLFSRDAWIIRKRNPDGVLIFNGHPFEVKKLNPGDHVNLGNSVLIFRDARIQTRTETTDLSNNPSQPVSFAFKVLNGPEKGRTVTLTPGDYVFGRCSPEEAACTGSNRIAFRNPYVSKNHARVTLDRNSMAVEDMNSTNGTRINNRSVLTGHCRHGDILRLGKMKLRVTVPCNPVEKPAGTETVRLRRLLWSVAAVVLMLCLYVFVRRYIM